MPATYQCAACHTTWTADREPGGCPQCGSRIIDRARRSDAAMADLYRPPSSSIVASSPVRSTAFSITYWLGGAGLILGFALLVAAGAASSGPPANEANQSLTIAGAVVLVASEATLLAAFILSLIKIYQGWDLIQPLRRLDRDEATMTTPGKAIGFLFIPFFNYYWNFVALHGLAVRANKYMLRSGIDARPMREGIAQTYCIMYVCLAVPCFGLLLVPVIPVLYYLFILDVDRMRGAIQMSRASASKPEFIDDFEAL